MRSSVWVRNGTAGLLLYFSCLGLYAQPTESPDSRTEGKPQQPVTIDPGENRPDEQFQTLLFGRPLTIGGAYEVQPRYEDNYRLTDDRSDELAGIDQELKIELLYRLNDTAVLFLQGKAFYEADLYSARDDKEFVEGIGWSQSWLFLDHIFDSDFSLQVGRQKFADRRQWWWNDELDALRLYYQYGSVHAELATAEQLVVKSSDELDIDAAREDLFLLLGDVIWRWADKQEVGLFYLSQFDHSEVEPVGALVDDDRDDKSDAELHWVGARAFGKFKVRYVGKLAYWLDAAMVTGRDTVRDFNDAGGNRRRVDAVVESDVLGWGVDAGIRWRLPLPFDPNLSLGYARGSGDTARNDSGDTAYRQSGLHRNRVRFEGEQRFFYYGEVLRPELSNLEIWTAAAGVPIFSQSSIDLLYHRYAQVAPTPGLKDTKLDRDPTGQSGDLGEELDLIVSLDEWKHVQAQFVAGAFRAGNAFGAASGETSGVVQLKLRYSF